MDIKKTIADLRSSVNKGEETLRHILEHIDGEEYQFLMFDPTDRDDDDEIEYDEDEAWKDMVPRVLIDPYGRDPYYAYVLTAKISRMGRMEFYIIPEGDSTISRWVEEDDIYKGDMICIVEQISEKLLESIPEM